MIPVSVSGYTVDAVVVIPIKALETVAHERTRKPRRRVGLVARVHFPQRKRRLQPGHGVARHEVVENRVGIVGRTHDAERLQESFEYLGPRRRRGFRGQ